MRTLIEKFPKQIAHAVEIGRATVLKQRATSFSNVVIAGLGGSGIGGKIVSQLVADEANVPIILINDYVLPAFVNEQSLVIISSYSGDTEETLAAMKMALEVKAEVAVITSGGEIFETATRRTLNCIRIPGGNPPRSQVGYSLIQQLFLLAHYGIVSPQLLDELSGVAPYLEREQGAIILEAGSVVSRIADKMPIIYCGSQLEGVAVRLRQQFNENAKILCWHHVFPELNHNELVGWASGNKDLAVILLRSAFDHTRTSLRMDISKEMIAEKKADVIEVEAKGASKLLQTMYLIHLGDWISLLLAERNSVDPIAIEAIIHLKKSLENIK